MGWSSGSSIFGQIIDVLKDRVEDDIREEIYADMIEIFENSDCDTLDELLGEDEAYDQAYYTLYPQDVEDEEVIYDY